MQFKIEKNQITRLDKELLTTENVNSVECSFSFSDDYDGLELYAVFYRDSTTNCFVSLNDGKCILPHELLEDAGNLYVGAYGVKNTSRRKKPFVLYLSGSGAHSGCMGAIFRYNIGIQDCL